jgi:hypothetical protein
VARRTLLASALAVLATALFAPSAFADAGNPNYESLVNGVTPKISGFSVVVLSGDDRLEVVNHSKQTITIDGYNKDPYLRMAPDGTVSVNIHSPAYYLDVDRTETAPIPAGVTPAAARNDPVWKVVAKDGRYQFHDHRIHWMSSSNPPQVKDKSVRTKIGDWQVPLHADGQNGAIGGTLFWRGSAGGPPAGAFIALALFLLLSAATVVIVRRRRAEGEDGGGGSGAGGAIGREPRAEAW